MAPRKQLSMEAKARALALLERGVPQKTIAEELKVTVMTIYRLKKAAENLPKGVTPPIKRGLGRPK